MVLIQSEDILKVRGIHWPKTNIEALKSPKGIISLLLGITVLWFSSGHIMTPPVVAPVIQKIPLFKVEMTKSQALPRFQEVNSRGSVVANKSISLFAQASGPIVEIPYTKGAAVKKGDVLIQLEDQDQSAKLKEAQARLDQRNLEYKASAELTQKAFSSESNLAQAKTNLESAVGALKTAEQNVKNLMITAPFDGIFNATDMEVGGMVGSALTLGSPVGTLIDMSMIKVVLQVPEKQASTLKLGLTAILTFPYADMLELSSPLEGQISYISHSADPKLKTYRVEITAPNPSQKIYEGMTAQARIPVNQTHAHLVNFSLLTLDELGNVGMKVVDDNAQVQFYKVTPLTMEQGKVWVTGLPETCNLISMGQDFVVHGEKVDAVSTHIKN